MYQPSDIPSVHGCMWLSHFIIGVSLHINGTAVRVLYTLLYFIMVRQTLSHEILYALHAWLYRLSTKYSIAHSHDCKGKYADIRFSLKMVCLDLYQLSS